MKTDSSEILDRLLAGNARYTSGDREGSTRTRSSIAVDGTSPLAGVLVCSDLGIAPDELFAVAPGDLHVMQTAVHVVSHGVVASVALARREHGLRLFLVIGHTPCGVMKAYDSQEGISIASIAHAIGSSRALADGEPASEETAAEAHALRVSEELQMQLDDPSIVVVPACVNEATGRVRLLRTVEKANEGSSSIAT